MVLPVAPAAFPAVLFFFVIVVVIVVFVAVLELFDDLFCFFFVQCSEFDGGTEASFHDFVEPPGVFVFLSGQAEDPLARFFFIDVAQLYGGVDAVNDGFVQFGLFAVAFASLLVMALLLVPPAFLMLPLGCKFFLYLGIFPIGLFAGQVAAFDGPLNAPFDSLPAFHFAAFFVVMAVFGSVVHGRIHRL